jgi:hypothetical protein
MSIRSYVMCVGLVFAMPTMAATPNGSDPSSVSAILAGSSGNIVLAQGGPPARPGGGEARGRGNNGGQIGTGGVAGSRGGNNMDTRRGDGGGNLQQQRRGTGAYVRGGSDVRGGADVRVRSRVGVRDGRRGDRWRHRGYGARVGVYIGGGRGWCHRHHWRWRVMRHCHPYSYRLHRHGRWR